MKIDSADFVRSAVGVDDFPADGRPEVAFAGRSNVGKSSLLNRLVGRKALARISSTPGRTRAVNLFLINRRLYFVDLPGYGYARAGKEERRQWAELVGRYLDHAASRGQVVLLVDAVVGATELDAQAREYLGSLGAAVTVVATKIDRVPRSRRARALAAVRETLNLGEEDRLVAVSARTGEGIRELWGAIAAQLA